MQLSVDFGMAADQKDRLMELSGRVKQLEEALELDAELEKQEQHSYEERLLLLRKDLKLARNTATEQKSVSQAVQSKSTLNTDILKQDNQKEIEASDVIADSETRITIVPASEQMKQSEQSSGTAPASPIIGPRHAIPEEAEVIVVGKPRRRQQRTASWPKVKRPKPTLKSHSPLRFLPQTLSQPVSPLGSGPSLPNRLTAGTTALDEVSNAAEPDTANAAIASEDGTAYFKSSAKHVAPLLESSMGSQGMILLPTEMDVLSDDGNKLLNEPDDVASKAISAENMSTPKVSTREPQISAPLLVPSLMSTSLADTEPIYRSATPPPPIEDLPPELTSSEDEDEAVARETDNNPAFNDPPPPTVLAPPSPLSSDEDEEML